MRRYLSVVWGAAVAGLALGAGWAALVRTPAWPQLNEMALDLGCAVGWLIGLVLGVVLAWVWSRRAAAPVSAQNQRRRAGPVVVAMAALAPAALWVTAAFPESALHKALIVGRRPGDSRPNLILITVDALRADHLGVYGNHAGLTPKMDAFAAQATTYEAAYTAAPWTMASLASVWSQLPPSQCNLAATSQEGETWYWQYARLDGKGLLSDRLHQAGYVTAAELTNPFLADTRGWSYGFEFFHHAPIPENMAPDMTRGEEVTRHTLDWLTRNRRQPFFLWVHYLDPHSPYDAPTAAAKEVRARYPKWRMGVRSVWEARKGSSDRKSVALYQESCRAMYAEEVRYADQCVGELLEGIKAAGLWDQSLIVITADHGEELFDHGGIDHGHTMHAELLHVPLLVKWPAGVSADRRVSQIVALASAGTTFLESAGTGPNARAAPALPRRDGEPGQVVYSEGPLYGAEQTALTTDRWRVIYHPTWRPAKQFEVYDRRRDPEEQHDLASTGAAADLREELRQLTEEARRTVARRATARASAKASPLTREEERQLKSLGYMR